MTVDAARLAALISPLRRALLSSVRERENLPDIPDAQIEVIRRLPRGTVASPSALADALGLSRSAISNLLAAMERDGLIVRRPGAADRRQVEVIASPAALDYFDRYDSAAAAFVGQAAATLTADERAAIDAALPALERLGDALSAARNDRDHPRPEATP